MSFNFEKVEKSTIGGKQSYEGIHMGKSSIGFPSAFVEKHYNPEKYPYVEFKVDPSSKAVLIIPCRKSETPDTFSVSTTRSKDNGKIDGANCSCSYLAKKVPVGRYLVDSVNGQGIVVVLQDRFRSL